MHVVVVVGTRNVLHKRFVDLFYYITTMNNRTIQKVEADNEIPLIRTCIIKNNWLKSGF